MHAKTRFLIRFMTLQETRPVASSSGHVSFCA